MVDTAEEIKHLPCPQPPYLREDIIPRLKAAGKRIARYIGVMERVAVLIFVVGGIGLVILRDAVGISEVGVDHTATDYPVLAPQLEIA